MLGSSGEASETIDDLVDEYSRLVSVSYPPCREILYLWESGWEGGWYFSALPGTVCCTALLFDVSKLVLFVCQVGTEMFLFFIIVLCFFLVGVFVEK